MYKAQHAAAYPVVAKFGIFDYMLAKMMSSSQFFNGHVEATRGIAYLHNLSKNGVYRGPSLEPVLFCFGRLVVFGRIRTINRHRV